MGKVSNRFYEFGPFRIDPGQGLLLRGGQPVPLQRKAFETLLVLVQNSEKVLLKDELMKTVWPDTIVEESNLAQNVFVLRKALEDTAHPHRYIETLPGRGYRFVAKVKEICEGNGDLAVDSDIASAIAVERPEQEPNLRQGARARILVFALGIVVVVATALFAWRRFHPGAEVGKITLAVLPFENLTGDAQQEYISDGITEEMITQLAGLHPEELEVIARTSVMGYKHGTKRLDQIARELGVQYVLEGSLRQAPGRLRVTVQLIQVKDQNHLWSQDYDRGPQDILSLQSEVASAVADEIQLRFTPGQRRRLSGPKTTNPEAYDHYLQGRYCLNKRTAIGFQKSLIYFQQALVADPDDALPYAGLAETHILMATYATSSEASIAQARSAAQKALTIDATLAEPHAILALIAQNHDWNWAEAEREYKLALASDANNATAHNWYAAGLAVRGRFEDGFREVAVARKLDPLALDVRANEAEMFYVVRQYDAALNKLNGILEMEPNFSGAHLIRGLVYEQKGMWKEALADLETARKLDDTPRTAGMLGQAYALAGDKARAKATLSELHDRAKRQYVNSLYPALIFMGLGEPEAAFSDLEKAYQERTTDLLGMKVSPLYDSLRSDPRFRDLVHRLGLDE